MFQNEACMMFSQTVDILTEVRIMEGVVFEGAVLVT